MEKVDGGGMGRRLTLSEKIAGCVGTLKAQQNPNNVWLVKGMQASCVKTWQTVWQLSAFGVVFGVEGL